MAEHDVEKVWAEFWVPCLDNAVEGTPLGQSVALPGAYFDQIKRELYDYHQMMDGLSLLYDEITGGRASKPNIDKRVIAQLVDERIEDEVAERVAEELEIKQIEADAVKWQEGYDRGFEDGRDLGFEDGLFEARSRI